MSSYTLRGIFDVVDTMIESAQIDYEALQKSSLNEHFFDDYNNTRIVNSFLFNFSKLQDKIGAKLFKQVLYETKEIDTTNQTMIDILHLLEQKNILSDIDEWERLREIRNILAHEYPFDIQERLENISIAMEGFISLKLIYHKLKQFSTPILQNPTTPILHE